MTADEYWNGDPWLAKAYRLKHYLDIETKNQELWLQGLYIYDAVGAIMSNAFAKKGAKKQKYVEKPFDIIPDSPLDRERKAQEERNKLIEQLTLWETNWKATHKDVR